MAGAYRSRSSNGKWVAWWKSADGRTRRRVGTADRASTLLIAQKAERDATLVREGLIDPHAETRREAARRPVADHIEDFRLQLVARGRTPAYYQATAATLRRLLDDAHVRRLADLSPERLQSALARLKARRSGRTANSAMTCAKSFVRWLADNGRIAEYPRGLNAIRSYPQRSDRRRVRRALTRDEASRLLAATEAGPDHPVRPLGKPAYVLAGPDRAMAYRVALGTGFRAEEVRTLTPGRFRLDGDRPTITVSAGFSKRGKRSGRDDVQPIRRDLAALLRPYLAGRPADAPVFPIPRKAAAMLAADLGRAGIAYKTEAGYVDFHSLRVTYITQLIRDGVNPKVAQKLARHSTIVLTLDVYAQVDDDELRRAVEGDQ